MRQPGEFKSNTVENPNLLSVVVVPDLLIVESEAAQAAKWALLDAREFGTLRQALKSG